MEDVMTRVVSQMLVKMKESGLFEKAAARIQELLGGIDDEDDEDDLSQASNETEEEEDGVVVQEQITLLSQEVQRAVLGWGQADSLKGSNVEHAIR